MSRRALELEMLQIALEPLQQRAPSLHRAPWLLSDFDESVWRLSIGKNSTLNFNVLLEDGSALVEKRNEELLLFFKHFLLSQTDLIFTRGVSYGIASLRTRLAPAIHICEYILVRSEQFGLARHGIASLNESQGYKMLECLALADSANSVYQWESRLGRFLSGQASQVSHKDIKSALYDRADIQVPYGCVALGMNADELTRARAWLWLNGMYTMGATGGRRTYILNVARLFSLLYPGGTLKNNWSKPHIYELDLGQGPKLLRERSSAPVRGEEPSEGSLRYYLRAVSAIPQLTRVDIAIPEGFMRASQDNAFIRQLKIYPPGRYATLKHSLVLNVLKQALEFSLKYGSALVDAYLSLARQAIFTNTPISHCFPRLFDHVDGKSLPGGLNTWSLSTDIRWSTAAPAESSHKESEFFIRFRANEGLYEMLQVFYGCLLVSIGALMARRQGEIIDLSADNYLDSSGTRLRFQARKINEKENREVLYRPIPSVLVGLLEHLKRLQSGLIELGAIESFQSLFALPLVHGVGLVKVADSSLNAALDRFCDYFEVESDERGHRFYIRQHQLRRFFALLFFWGNSYSGLETLRWFLGHADAQHLYNYITESIPGEVLRNVKTEYVLEQIRDGNSSSLELSRVLEARFGVGKIRLLDNDELGAYLEELLINDRLTVEPLFFDGHTGREYTILIRVNGESHVQSFGR